MTQAHTEIETKLYIPDLEAIQQRLESAGGTLSKPRVYERNVRYDNVAQTLSPNGIVLRLREDTSIRLTYKQPGIVQDGIVSRYEAEVEVSNFATMESILGYLGFHPFMIYEKYRTTYHLNEAEIVLDEMPYGNFVEIEGDISTIQQTIQLLDLSEVPRFGYSYARLFDFVKTHLGLDCRDLTFDNFAGIVVPASAFQPPTIES